MEKGRDTIEKVVAEYGDMVYRLALHYVRDRFDAEDVVQEVLLAFFQREIPKERQKAWLLRVTVNKSLDVLRKRKRQTALTHEPTETAEEKLSLSEELQSLPPLDREIVYLHWFEGYTSKEIAKLVHLSDGAVRKRLERAKKKLKEILETNV